MNRIQLRFEAIHEISGTEQMSVILLTNMERSRSISVACDAVMATQVKYRLNHSDVCKLMLPEVLAQLLPSTYEMLIVGVFEGQYQVLLMDLQSGQSLRLRLSDAVLLHLIARVPLFIEERLFHSQSYPFEPDNTAVAIPINTMSLERLKKLLDRVVEDENYEMASQIRDEIGRRNKSK